MLKYLTTISGALTALLYVHGQVYWEGYLRELSVPVDLFKASFEDTLIQGYIAYTVIGLPYLFVAFTYMLIGLFIVHNVNEITKIPIATKVINYFSDKNGNKLKKEGHHTTELALNYGKRFTISIGLIVAFMIVSVLFISKIDSAAKESAQQEKQKYLVSINKDTYTIKGEKDVVGNTVTCSNKFCAVYQDKSTIVIPLILLSKIEYMTVQ